MTIIQILSVFIYFLFMNAHKKYLNSNFYQIYDIQKSIRMPNDSMRIYKSNCKSYDIQTTVV